jgi:hypothetical protein
MDLTETINARRNHHELKEKKQWKRLNGLNTVLKPKKANAESAGVVKQRLLWKRQSGRTPNPKVNTFPIKCCESHQIWLL